MVQPTTTTPSNVITDGYFAMWGETDAARRREIIAMTWSEDARYMDPMFTAEGHAGLDILVRDVHEQFPGLRFSLVGSVDVHHDRARWAWQFAESDGAPPLAVGVDYAELAPDGRLRAVTGFIDQVASSGPPPAVAAAASPT